MLIATLRAQCPELYKAIHAHVRDAVTGLQGDDNAEYEAGQYAAVAEAVEYGLNGIEHGENWSAPVPPATIAQARRAARDGVPWDTVLRRYHAGQAKLAETIAWETERNDLLDQAASLRLMLRLQALHNHLTAEVAVEYEREVTRLTRSPEQHRSERVQRLLVGTSSDTSGLDYQLEHFWHICVIAVGDRADMAVSVLADTFNRRLLPIPRSKELVWAWLGGPRRLAAADVQHVPLEIAASGVILALGEPGRGIEGWRLTHRQAQATLRVALYERQALTRFVDVGLLAPWLAADHTLTRSFIHLHLSALNELTEGGAVARETLRAYFKVGHQVAAAAAALKIDRSTLRKRLVTIEKRLGYALPTRQAELEVALRLETLYTADSRATTPESPADAAGDAI